MDENIEKSALEEGLDAWKKLIDWAEHGTSLSDEPDHRAIKKSQYFISAKIKDQTEKIIKKSEYTYSDALDFFAIIISDNKTRLRAEVKYTNSEITELKRKQKWIEMEIAAKEDYLEKLMNDFQKEEKIFDSKNVDNPDSPFK